jgi:hypothetical protein
MDHIIRRLKIAELQAIILRHDLERRLLNMELASFETTTERRGWIFRRLSDQELEDLGALKDIEWLKAEERLRRPDRGFRMSP